MSSIIHHHSLSVQPDSKKIAIYLTNKCNLKCKHCFIEGNPHNNDFLTNKQISTGLKYFYKQGYRLVEFTGGESCLSPYFFKAIKEAINIGFRIGINTNGIKSSFLDKISPLQIVKITYSLDGGKAKTHDFLRGPDVFHQCIKSIKKAIELGFRTEAIFTVHQMNLNEIPLAIKLLDKLGVKKLSFNFISNQGTATLNQNLLLPPNSWIKAKKLIESNSDTKQMDLRYPVIFATPKEFKEITKHNPYFCRLSDPVKTEIYPNGKIFNCCLVTDMDSLSSGYVTDTKVVINEQSKNKFLKKYRHLSCPVHQIRRLYASTSNLIPVCLYYKTITCASNSDKLRSL